MQEKRKFNYMNLLLILVFVLGLGILLYPNISNFFNERNSSKAMGEYDETIAEMNEKERQAMIEAANQYNRKLAQNSIGRFADFTPEQLEEYMNTLNVDGNGMMCYLKIDKLGLSLPVFHGTTEDVLQKYVGHVEGTSLPVGGLGTHAALSGHRGLPSAVLFTNIDRLEVGDFFTIAVLGEEHLYQIDQINTVLPDDLSDLAIDPNKDYVTLITCTPYGVNTHRLMIRGVRIPDENVKEFLEEQGDVKKKLFDFTREQIVNMIAAGLTAIFLFIVLPLLLIPPVPRRVVYLRPWDDNMVDVFNAAIRISELATRANWEMDEVLGPVDFIAALRRWDDTLNHSTALSEEDEFRAWNEYLYDDDDDHKDENLRQWKDDILEDVDQDWSNLDRKGFQHLMNFRDIVDFMEEQGDDVKLTDMKDYFQHEKEWGDELRRKYRLGRRKKR